MRYTSRSQSDRDIYTLFFAKLDPSSTMRKIVYNYETIKLKKYFVNLLQKSFIGLDLGAML